MTATVVKFPFSVARRAHARRPRVSKNGTPEERAAKQGTLQGDPIFAAIERHKYLDAAADAIGEKPDYDEEAFGDAVSAAWDALTDAVVMTPATLAGCVALLRHLNDVDVEAARPFRGTSIEGAADDLFLRLADRIEAV